MRLTLKALNHIKKYEGCRLEAFRDASAIWTIGYGHTTGVYRGMVITEEEADAFLRQDIELLENVIRTFKRCGRLSLNRWDAVVCLAYRIGLGNFKKSVLLKRLQKNPDNPNIYKQFLRWDKARGEKREILRRRCIWEAQRWEAEV